MVAGELWVKYLIEFSLTSFTRVDQEPKIYGKG